MMKLCSLSHFLQKKQKSNGTNGNIFLFLVIVDFG